MDVRLLLRVLHRRRALRAREAWSRERLARHQAEALGALRDFALARSPFYRRFHAGLRDRPLAELPVLTKADLMANWDDVATDRRLHLADAEEHLAGEARSYAGDGRDDHRGASRRAESLGRYTLTATSGTTGRRGLFAHDADEWAWVMASYARANQWAGLAAGPLHRMRMAVVSSRTPWHQSARVGSSVGGRMVPTLRLDATDDLAGIVARLNAFRPQSLVAYASMAGVLADEQLAGRLRISPEAVMCSSEVLTADMRRRVARAWGAPPFEVYAATETAGIASECERHDGMHAYEDLVIAEAVDEKNRPVPAGTFGARLLVTVLFSRTLPLIRYELSDSVSFRANAACPCGRPFALLGAVQGRREDALDLPARSGGQVTVHPNIFHRLLEGVPVAAWQVARQPDGVEVRVRSPREGFDAAALADAVTHALRATGADAPAVRVVIVPALATTAMGKTPLIATETRGPSWERAGS